MPEMLSTHQKVDVGQRERSPIVRVGGHDSARVSNNIQHATGFPVLGAVGEKAHRAMRVSGTGCTLAYYGDLGFVQACVEELPLVGLPEIEMHFLG
jgi:hypothetical protein